MDLLKNIYVAESDVIRPDLLENISHLIQHSIAQGYYAGAVVLVHHQDAVIYRGTFGHRRILPDVAPMQADTIFDLASLTKVIVTTTGIMQLLERGKLELEDTVQKFWPEFADKEKNKVTLRQLLTHTSGLQALTPEFPPMQDAQQNYSAGLKAISALGLAYPAGSKIVYSDVNMMVLGYIIELVSGFTLSQYAQENIFQPLNMQHTAFFPPKAWRDNIAPTEQDPNSGELRWGEVHDPASFCMGGATGVAGLFSHADDISTFLRCLLALGKIPEKKVYLLSPLSVLKMTTPQTPSDLPETRGLGWDLDSVYSNRGVLLPMGSYGHTGWTGTSLWADPATQTSIIILTSRLHPRPYVHSQLSNPLTVDRRCIANIVAASLTHLSMKNLSNTGGRERMQIRNSR
jgi:CubicO group peptidase (beta-lactamase class C family)